MHDLLTWMLDYGRWRANRDKVGRWQVRDTMSFMLVSELFGKKRRKWYHGSLLTLSKKVCFYNHESQASLSSLWSYCMWKCSLFENDTPILEHVIRYLFLWIIHGLRKANDSFKRALIKNQLEIPEHVVNASDLSLGKHDSFNIVYIVDSHDKKDESLDTKKPWILHPLYSYIINSSSHDKISRSSYPSFMISLYY